MYCHLKLAVSEMAHCTPIQNLTYIHYPMSRYHLTSMGIYIILEGGSVV